MTEMPGVGSYAAAAVHKSVFGIINEQDRMLVRDTLNRTLIRYDMQLNAPNIKEEYYPVFDFKKSPIEDTTMFLSTVETVVRLGITVSARQVREYTGLREPMEGEELVQAPPPEEIEPGAEPKPGEQNGKSNNKNAKTSSKKKTGSKAKSTKARVS